MTVQISVRWYSGDAQRHVYRVEQLRNLGWENLTPLCQEFPYPWRHPRDMIGIDDLPELGDSFESCPGCSVWARQNPHAVTMRGIVPPLGAVGAR